MVEPSLPMPMHSCDSHWLSNYKAEKLPQFKTFAITEDELIRENYVTIENIENFFATYAHVLNELNIPPCFNLQHR